MRARKWLPKWFDEESEKLAQKNVVWLFWIGGPLGFSYFVAAAIAFIFAPSTELPSWFPQGVGKNSLIKLIIFGFTFAVYGGAIFFYRYSKGKVDALYEEYGAMKAIGLSKFHEPLTEGENEWKQYCANEIRDSGTHDLKILAITGWNTFGNMNSPLHDVVREFKGDLTILLLDQNSDGMKERLEELATEEKWSIESEKSEKVHRKLKYLAEYEGTITFCKKLALKKNGINSIVIRAYSDIPIWKLISLGSRVWVQQYDAAISTAKSPIFVFQKNVDGVPSFVSTYEKIWNLRWRSSTLVWEHPDGAAAQRREARSMDLIE